MQMFGTLMLAAAVGLTQHAQSSHGALVMGFDQTTTTHHFYLYEDGGAIDISVKDAADTKNRDAIRAHLPHIAMMFGEGDFNAPMLVHETKDVPGIKELAAARSKISYSYAETPRGGRVNIVTTDRQALDALYRFLKYQITEHKTGDALVPTKRK